MKRASQDWRSSRRLADEGGAAAVEFAIVLPLLVLLVLGLVDYGAGLWEAMMVGNAARAGAYWAAVNGWTNNSPGDIETAVTSATQLGSITATPAPKPVCYCYDPTNTSPSGLGTPASGSVTPTTCAATTCTSPQTPACYVQVNATSSYSPLVAITGLKGLGFNFSISGAISLQATSYARTC